MPKKHIVVLREASGRYVGIWVQDNPVQTVCGQQNGRRETAHSVLERGQPQDIMCKQKLGSKNDPVDRFRILKDAQVTWKETRLPGNVDKLLSTRRSANTHGIILKGSA